MDEASVLRGALQRVHTEKTSAVLGGIFESFQNAGKMPWLQRRRSTPLQRTLFQVGYWGVPLGLGWYAGEKSGLFPRLRGEGAEMQEEAGHLPPTGSGMQQTLQRIQSRTQGAP